VSRFEFETGERGAVALVTLRGELDLAALPVLGPELERLAGAPGFEAVVLDLRGLDFLDSSGLRLLVEADRALGDCDRGLVLVRGPQPVQRMFELTRMADRLDFVDAPDF
jgi:anti-sigma B factor antagonist